MELARAFRFGGNVIEAFQWAYEDHRDFSKEEKSGMTKRISEVWGESFPGNLKLPRNTL
jgi:hypothetical protein